MDGIHQGQFVSQDRVSGVSTYGVATPRPLNASLPFRCTLKGTRDTLLKNHPYAVGETVQVNGVHGSDQLEASLNPQEAAGEGTVVLPSPGWEDEVRTRAHVSFPHPRHGHGLKPQESGTGAWATSPR